MQNEIDTFNPLCDGKTHIRISPMADTELGKKLDIGAKIDIVHPYHGYFASLLAYWVWISEGGIIDSVRYIHQSNMIKTSLSLVRCKSIGKDDVIAMLEYWLVNTPDIKRQLCESNLPIVAYDDLKLGPKNYHIIERHDLNWYVDAIIELRSKLSVK